MVYCPGAYSDPWFTVLVVIQTQVASQTHGLLPQQILTLMVYCPDGYSDPWFTASADTLMVYCPDGYSDPWFTAPADTHTYGLLP